MKKAWTTKNNIVVPNKALAGGRIDLRKLGIPLGWYHKRQRKKVRWQILNVGLIQIGITTYFVGVCVSRKDIFIGRDGKLWRYEGIQLREQVPSILGLDKEDLTAWADAISRAIIDRLSSENETEVLDKSNLRYRKIVKALVQQRILDAATLGYECTPETFARGISVSWDYLDLLNPRIASIRHATLVSLVLALEADKAAQLIELAALIEMRVPMVSREAALSIYQQSVSLLSRLCPQWWNQGYTCNWSLVGDIDRLFRAQYIRMINNAFDSGIQFETAGGQVLRDMTESEAYYEANKGDWDEFIEE
jgi:hypothetical protein